MTKREVFYGNSDEKFNKTAENIIGITDKAEFCKDKHLRKACLNIWNGYFWAIRKLPDDLGKIYFSKVDDKKEW